MESDSEVQIKGVLKCERIGNKEGRIMAIKRWMGRDELEAVIRANPDQKWKVYANPQSSGDEDITIIESVHGGFCLDAQLGDGSRAEYFGMDEDDRDIAINEMLDGMSDHICKFPVFVECKRAADLKPASAKDDLVQASAKDYAVVQSVNTILARLR